MTWKFGRHTSLKNGGGSFFLMYSWSTHICIIQIILVHTVSNITIIGPIKMCIFHIKCISSRWPSRTNYNIKIKWNVLYWIWLQSTYNQHILNKNILCTKKDFDVHPKKCRHFWIIQYLLLFVQEEVTHFIYWVTI